MSAKGKINILMVDDEPGKLLSYEVMLGELGENLIKAHSGREALELLLKTDVAVLLMDVSMPEMDGFELADIIHQHPRFQQMLGRFVKRGEKGIFILAPMVGRRSTKDVATDERSEDATTEGQRTLYGFRAVYIFDRLSRDLRPSLCALDVIPECHFRKSPR